MLGGWRLFWTLTALFLFCAALFAEDNSAPAATAGPPKVPVHVVEDTVHGHTISDPYRWLENGDSPETQQFVHDQLAYTRSILDPLPLRDQIHKRLTELLSLGAIAAPQIGGPYYFYTRREGKQNQPVLLVREGLNGKDRALVDPNQMSSDGTAAMDWWYPSDDGKYVAYGISSSGSEQSVLHVVETASGKVLPDTIDRTRFGSVAWKKDNSGFYYDRNPQKGDVPTGEEVYHVKVFYHALGSDPSTDKLFFGDGLGAQEIPGVQFADDDSRWLLIKVFVTYVKAELYLQDLQAGTPPVKITPDKEALYDGEIFGGELYITSNEDAPRFRMFVADVAHPQRDNWKEAIPQSDAVLLNIGVFGKRLLGLYEKNASSQLKLFELSGKAIFDVPLPTIGSVAGLGGKWDRNEMFFGFQSFTVPPSVYRVDLSTNQTALWDKITAPIDPAAYEVKQLWFNSKDGTKVPMFVFHKKGLKLDGKSPALLTGYGGFNISMTPQFVPDRFVWLDHGGVFAVANLRGGAEFGEEWHRAGMLEKKQNVFDDFIAAAEYLIAQKYTDKDHLAIRGGSNGGLLMGAMITQRPDLFRAVVCQVPLLDMLRYQNFLIAKLWVPEYGSADDPRQFDWLYAYSPYHHLKPGAEYPSILFMTADSDSRVDPMHAKKMAALMQAQAANGQSRERPILLRIEPKAGHGVGKPISKQIEEQTDINAFLFWQLGVKQ
jgi:prolyl oligopeptidase